MTDVTTGQNNANTETDCSIRMYNTFTFRRETRGGKRTGKSLCCISCVSAPVRVGGSTALDTLVQVSKTCFKSLCVLQTMKVMHDQ